MKSLTTRAMSRVVLGPVMIATGLSGPVRVDVTVSAQALNPCALLTVDEIDQIASASVAEGVSSSLEAAGSVTCRYTWGAGVNRDAPRRDLRE